MHRPDDPPTGIDPAWLARILDRSSDLPVVLEPDLTVRWVGSSLHRHTGYHPSDVLGRSMAEFVHPDDLLRGAEVIALSAQGGFGEEAPTTAALYRVLHADGRWIDMEINSTSDPESGEVLVLIRPGGDVVVTDRLLEAVTGGATLGDQLDLVLELGRWRHPANGYVVRCADAEGWTTRSTGVHDPLLTGEGGAEAEPTPWSVAATRGEIVVVEDLDERALVPAEMAAAARRSGFTWCLAAPVADPAYGDPASIVVWSTPGGPNAVGQDYPVRNMIRALSLVLEWRSHKDHLERAAHIDALTGLLSRSRLLQLAAEPPYDDEATILYIDLDGFKGINDRLGHAAGDEVLRVVAARLQPAVGSRALVGRMGGDEFVVVAPGSTDRGPADLAASVVDAVSQPIRLDTRLVRVGASVGVASRRRDEATADSVDRADRALLGMKSEGKGGWRLAEEG